MDELYLMKDGTYVPAGDCKKDDKGVLRGPNGVEVAIDSEGKPETIERVVENGNVAAASGQTDPVKLQELMTGSLEEAQAKAESMKSGDEPAPAAETPAEEEPPKAVEAPRTPAPAPAHAARAPAKPADNK